MAEASTSTTSTSGHIADSHITEDEASLYDRQIRLWGLEAQNRMRCSTVLLLSLRSLAHETIKNLVLAGIGRLIVMDDGVVTEEELGGGFLFREEEGCVGLERTTAALPQISSLNPLVSLTVLPTLSPFVRDPSTAAAEVDQGEEMVDFLRRERVDVVVTCDLERVEMEAIDSAARGLNVKYYGAGTYGFYGYVFADLGEGYEYVHTPPSTKDDPSPGLVKKFLSYPSLATVLDSSTWDLPWTESAKGGSPFRGITRNATRDRVPGVALGVLALWEFQLRHKALPTGNDGQEEELTSIAERLRKELGINEKALPVVDPNMLEHLSIHATHSFPPTLAILGGLLAQDVLRALSRKDKPITNLLAVDTMGGSGTVGRWAMGDAVDR